MKRATESELLVRKHRSDFLQRERRLFDLEPCLAYPAFAPLAEQNLFMKAHASNGTVAWNDEIDLSLDTIYLRGTR